MTFRTGLILEACSVKPSWFLKKNTKPYTSKIKSQVNQSLFDLDLLLPKTKHFYNLYDTRWGNSLYQEGNVFAQILLIFNAKS